MPLRGNDRFLTEAPAHRNPVIGNILRIGPKVRELESVSAEGIDSSGFSGKLPCKEVEVLERIDVDRTLTGHDVGHRLGTQEAAHVP